MQREASSQQGTTSLASPTKWDYQCIFCDRTFDSGRALGGHQNAHRFETRKSKRTHHVRVPKKESSLVVPHKSLWPPPMPTFWPLNPMTMQGGLPPREDQWEILVARAGQRMPAEGSRNGLNADGVEEVDLELKL